MTETYIIAEAGVNHNGSLDCALNLVETAANCGANAVKFQTFFAASMTTQSAPKADYQKQTTGTKDTQLEMLSRLELKREDHHKLKKHAEKCKIEFLSAPFGLEELDFLINEIGIEKIKLPSGEITNGPLLLAAAHTKKPIILSTGMCDLDEVTNALSVLAFGYISAQHDKPSLDSFARIFQSNDAQHALREHVTLLHCTTQYPTPLSDVNLLAMDTLKSHFNLPVGYSDHTQGIVTSIAAAARGACVLEKHFTLDRHMKGPDHAASLEPDDLKHLVGNVRDIEQLLGSADKVVAHVEAKNRVVARKSLVASCTICKGIELTLNNVTAKRPGDGLVPLLIWEILGTKAVKDYAPNDQIHNDQINHKT